MHEENNIPEPLLFNPLKHYLPFIRDFINRNTMNENDPRAGSLIRQLKHIGTCVMDIYSGRMDLSSIYAGILDFLSLRNLTCRIPYMKWTGTGHNDYRIITLSDDSRWTLKYFDSENRYVHIFPARLSPYTFRIKANTLKSAIVYLMIIGKDYISGDDLNRARAFMGLSPVREVADSEAVTELIEILRN
jgi:hypothetical protein